MYTIEKTKRQGDILFAKLVMDNFSYDVFGVAFPLSHGSKVINAAPIVLAEGETTGHMHRIVDTAPVSTAVVFGDLARLNPTRAPRPVPSRDELRRVFGRVGDSIEPEQVLGVVFVEEESRAEISHEEHAPVTLESGVWVALRQRTWSAIDNKSIAAWD